MGVTEGLAEFVVETTYESLPQEAIDEARRCTLETVANNLLGSASGLAKRVAAELGKGDESPEAMLMGIGKKRSLRTAAFFNSLIADINDSCGGAERSVVHHGKNVVPVSLTTASAKEKSGRDMITAMMVAIECYTRIDRVMCSALNTRGYYSDGPVGTIGTAITVGKLFGLDKETMQGAIGNAALLAPCTVGGASLYRSEARPLPLGMASANGILSVMMAQSGVKGPGDILECSGGFCQALAGITDPCEVTKDLGKVWWGGMGRPTNLYHKPFIGCRLTYVPRQGAQILEEKHRINPDDIERVTVRLSAAGFHIMNHYPAVGGNIIEHSASTPYLTANVLMYDDVGSGCLTEERMNDPKVHMLANKIEIVPDPELTKLAETHWEAGGMGNMEIITKRGDKYSYSAEYRRGDPIKWRMTDDELKDKLREYASGVLSRERIERVIEMILRLEELDNMAELMNLLAEN